MAEKQTKRSRPTASTTLFTPLGRRRHPHLFLKKYLEEQALKRDIDAAELERVGLVLKQWP